MKRKKKLLVIIMLLIFLMGGICIAEEYIPLRDRVKVGDIIKVFPGSSGGWHKAQVLDIDRGWDSWGRIYIRMLCCNVKLWFPLDDGVKLDENK